MEKHSWLRAAASTAEDVNTSNRAALDGVARGDDRAPVRELGAQLVQPCDVGVVGMVRREPSKVGQRGAVGECCDYTK